MEITKYQYNSELSINDELDIDDELKIEIIGVETEEIWLNRYEVINVIKHLVCVFKINLSELK